MRHTLTQKPQPKTLDEAQRVIDLLWPQVQQLDGLRQRVEELEGLLEKATEDKRGAHSGNSDQPPSSDSIAQRAQRKNQHKKSDRARGGQPGHPKHERPLSEHVDEQHEIFAAAQCACGGSTLYDHTPQRHQIFDIPPQSVHVTEYRLHHGHCACCHSRIRARWPRSVPASQMGAGMIALICHLSARARLSVGVIQEHLHSIYGVYFSRGAICKAQSRAAHALGPLYAQVQDQARSAQVGHCDETTHWRSGEHRWMWVLNTASAVFFMTHFSRGKAAAQRFLADFSGWLITDNYAAYDFYNPDRRQLCWAHLIRHFVRLCEKSAVPRAIGRRLLRLARMVIHLEHQWREHPQHEIYYRSRIARCRMLLYETLHRGSQVCGDAKGLKRLRNQCIHLLKYESLLWTFLKDRRISLTNNAAERALRGYVIWRKMCYGTWSATGDQFRAAVLSITLSAERLGVNSYPLMRSALEQWLRGEQVTVRLPFKHKAIEG